MMTFSDAVAVRHRLTMARGLAMYQRRLRREGKPYNPYVRFIELGEPFGRRMTPTGWLQPGPYWADRRKPMKKVPLALRRVVPALVHALAATWAIVHAWYDFRRYHQDYRYLASLGGWVDYAVIMTAFALAAGHTRSRRLAAAGWLATLAGVGLLGSTKGWTFDYGVLSYFLTSIAALALLASPLMRRGLGALAVLLVLGTGCAPARPRLVDAAYEGAARADAWERCSVCGLPVKPFGPYIVGAPSTTPGLSCEPRLFVALVCPGLHVRYAESAAAAVPQGLRDQAIEECRAREAREKRAAAEADEQRIRAEVERRLQSAPKRTARRAPPPVPHDLVPQGTYTTTTSGQQALP